MWMRETARGCPIARGQEEVGDANAAPQDGFLGCGGVQAPPNNCRVRLSEGKSDLMRSDGRNSGQRGTTPPTPTARNIPELGMIALHNRPIWQRFAKIGSSSHEKSTLRPRFCPLCGGMDLYDGPSGVIFCRFCRKWSIFLVFGEEFYG